MTAILRVRDENGNVVDIPAIKGKDGADGYTPIKGIDYFDGAKGEDGKQGVSGVYIGSEEPTDDGINVWINTNGNVVTEQWVFTLEDGTEVIKEVYVK